MNHHTDTRPGSPAAPAAIVNLSLGWTFIGWVVALAMACGSTEPGTLPRGWYPGQDQPPVAPPPRLPPGWFPDAAGTHERYWNGRKWSDLPPRSVT
jgi:Superinfection immunity protein/Protein of unknown function (DUF2510)